MNIPYPELPHVKQKIVHAGNNMYFSLEAIVMQKLVAGEQISNVDEDILKQSIDFNKELYSFLKKVPLSKLTESDAEKLIAYVIDAIGLVMNPTNDITFHNVFRVTVVSADMLDETGKVRDIKYLMHRPIDLVRKHGYYSRANTVKSTVFYCSFLPGVAIHETKPKKGDRIILTRWKNTDGQKFTSCPIAYNKGIQNENTQAAVDGLEKLKARKHPLLAQMMDMYTDFFGSELVKKVECTSGKKFEYLYGALFGDQILNNYDSYYGPGTKEPACLIYPSVAYGHREENLAIASKHVPRLSPLDCTDGIVWEELYEKLAVNEMELPIVFGRMRIANRFEGNKIIWNDD